MPFYICVNNSLLFSFLRYLGAKLKQKRFFSASVKQKSPVDEARELLASTILAHVPVSFMTQKNPYQFFLVKVLFQNSLF